MMLEKPIGKGGTLSSYARETLDIQINTGSSDMKSMKPYVDVVILS